MAKALSITATVLPDARAIGIFVGLPIATLHCHRLGQILTARQILQSLTRRWSHALILPIKTTLILPGISKAEQLNQIQRFIIIKRQAIKVAVESPGLQITI